MQRASTPTVAVRAQSPNTATPEEEVWREADPSAGKVNESTSWGSPRVAQMIIVEFCSSTAPNQVPNENLHLRNVRWCLVVALGSQHNYSLLQL